MLKMALVWRSGRSLDARHGQNKRARLAIWWGLNPGERSRTDVPHEVRGGFNLRKLVLRIARDFRKVKRTAEEMKHDYEIHYHNNIKQSHNNVTP